MVSKFIKYIFILAFFCIANLDVMATSTCDLNDKINFLFNYRDYVRQILRINSAHAKSLKMCIDHTSPTAGCDSGNCFTYHYQTADGFETTQRNCDPTIKAVLLNRIATEYPKMRRALVMSSGALFSEFSDPVFAGMDKLYSNKRLSYDVSRGPVTPRHPFLNLNSNDSEFAVMTPVTSAEKLSFHKDFLAGLYKNCLEFTASSFWNHQVKKGSLISPDLIDKKTFCSEISSDLPNEIKGPPTPMQFSKDKLRAHFLSWSANNKTAKMKEKFQDEYLQTIASFPILAYVHSANPSPVDLNSALEKIAANSVEVVKNQDEKDTKHNLSLKIKDWQKKSSNSNDGTKLYSDLLDYLDIQALFANAVNDPDLLNMLKGNPLLSNCILKDWQDKKKIESTIELSEFVAINAACFLPIGRVLGVAGKVVSIASKLEKSSSAFRPLCFTMTGLPVNSYFLGSSLNNYKSTQREIFSSPEGKYLLQEIGDLDSAKSEVILTTLFLPIGAQPHEIISGASLLTKKAQESYLKYAGKKQEAGLLVKFWKKTSPE